MKILSFDIGSSSIKAVELDSTFGRIELSDYFIERVVESTLEEVQHHQQQPPTETTAPEAQSEESKKSTRQILTPGQLAALRRIFSERQLRFDRLIVNFPKGWATTRVFQFPTKDRKTIQSSLNFELDDDIPFPIDDVIYDFAALNHDGINSSVFSAVALKSDITLLLSELQMLGIDPDMVTVECWGMGQLLKRAIPKDYEGRPVCIVNLGNKQTAIHMFVGEGPVLTHISQCAGSDITRAIAQAYNLTYDQAEKAKVDGAFLLTKMHLSQEEYARSVTADQKKFSETIEDALIPTLREIKQTLMSYKSHSKLSPRAIFITGGTSLIPNMPLFLEEQLKIPVFPLAYMSRIVGQTLKLSEASEALISSATGLALSMVKIDRNYTINFRKDEFSKHSGLGRFDLKSYKRPLQYLAASLGFVYLNLFAQSLILSSRATKQEAQLERSIKSVVGAVSSSALHTYVSSPSALKSEVAKEIAKYKNTTVAPAKPVTSAYEVLNKISGTIPKDMTLDVNLFEIKDGKFKLTGIVDKITNSDRIAKALEETKLLTELTKGKTEEDPKTKKVNFEITGKVADASSASSPGATNVKTR